MAAHITLRGYQPSDWQSVCAVHDASRPDELRGSVDARAFKPMAEAAQEDQFFESETVVACDGERVVGFVSFCGATSPGCTYTRSTTAAGSAGCSCARPCAAAGRRRG